MKKIFIIAIVLLALPAFSFAADVGPSDETVTLTVASGITTMTVQMSNQVFLYYVSTNGTTFGLGTYHSKGDRSYASTSEDAVIYWTSGTGVEGYTASPGVGSSGAPSGGTWTTL